MVKSYPMSGGWLKTWFPSSLSIVCWFWLGSDCHSMSYVWITTPPCSQFLGCAPQTSLSTCALTARSCSIFAFTSAFLEWKDKSIISMEIRGSKAQDLLKKWAGVVLLEQKGRALASPEDAPQLVHMGDANWTVCKGHGTQKRFGKGLLDKIITLGKQSTRQVRWYGHNISGRVCLSIISLTVWGILSPPMCPSRAQPRSTACLSKFQNPFGQL